MVQERPADLHQVGFVLALERDVRPDAGVYERVVADPVAEREAAQERPVRGGQRRRQRLSGGLRERSSPSGRATP